MSNPLNTLKTSDEIQDEEDRVGGAPLLDSGVYEGKITMAYIGESAGGAMFLHTAFDINGQEVRQRFYMTSGRQKGQKNYYETQAGEKRYLPGFNMANALALLTLGKEIAELDTETKVIKLYNFEAKAEVPTEVPVVSDLLNQEITLGIIRQTVDKVKKDNDGNYQATGETREENEIDKFFRQKDKLTTAEIRGGVQEAGFIHTWESKWAGQTRDKSSSGGTASNAQTSSALGSKSGSSGKPTQSLFN